MLSTLLLPLLMALNAWATPMLTPPPRIETMLAGTYSNEEQVYFAREANLPPIPFRGLRIDRQGADFVFQRINEFGTAQGPATQWQLRRYQAGDNNYRFVRNDGTCEGGYSFSTRAPDEGYELRSDSPSCAFDTLPMRVTFNGVDFAQDSNRELELRRARPFTCWVSVRRHADRANGEADWSFDRALPIHDQGGRVLVSPEGAPPVVIRMRNVVWPAPSTNRPSLVLYVHRPETPDRAESYSWADPDARMVGINLRWMQASCTRVGDAS